MVPEAMFSWLGVQSRPSLACEIARSDQIGWPGHTKGSGEAWGHAADLDGKPNGGCSGDTTNRGSYTTEILTYL